MANDAYAKRIAEIERNLHGFEDGLNANMCEAVLAILNSSYDKNAECAATWSPEWPSSKQLMELRPIRLQSKAINYLDSAARHLRSRVEDRYITLQCGLCSGK